MRSYLLALAAAKESALDLAYSAKRLIFVRQHEHIDVAAKHVFEAQPNDGFARNCLQQVASCRLEILERDPLQLRSSIPFLLRHGTQWQGLPDKTSSFNRN